jgi:hypothetical protein
MKNLKMILAVTVVLTAAAIWLVPSASAANIITFGDNANACGGAVMCSTNGTTGYLINGTGQAFDLSTLPQWFQIDQNGVSYLPGQPVEPDAGAGGFRVVNDTGAAITSYSITFTDTFTSSTASVVPCTGAKTGNPCDNFQAHGGNAGFNTELSGPDWDSCTQGTTVGNTCQGGAGGVAANFAPGTVTYTWSGATIAAGADFDITFASWQQGNSAFVTPGPSSVPEPSSLILSATGLFSAAGLVRLRFNN